MTTMTKTTQSHEITIEATPQAIWEAITRSEVAERYGYGSKVEYDLRPGGAYRVSATAAMVEYGMPELMIEGEVVEAEEPRRLVQTWHALFDAEIAAEEPTRLTWEIEPGANGATTVRIVHDLEGAPRTAPLVSGEVEKAGGGWPHVLRDMKALLETGESSITAQTAS